MIAPDPKKAMKYEQKGDKLYAKGKFRDALKLYQESEAPGLGAHRDLPQTRRHAQSIRTTPGARRISATR